MHNNLAKTSYDFSHIFAFLQLATLRSSKSFSFVLSLHYKIIGQVPSKHCPLPSTVSIVHITVTSLKNIPTPLHSPHSLNYSHLANLKHSTIFTQAAKCFWEKENPHSFAEHSHFKFLKTIWERPLKGSVFSHFPKWPVYTSFSLQTPYSHEPPHSQLFRLPPTSWIKEKQSDSSSFILWVDQHLSVSTLFTR